MKYKSENRKPGNMEESLHNRDYLKPFLDKPIKEDSLMADFGRERICLNGRWNYFLDQYDTCLRAGWYKFSNSRSILENFRDQFERFGFPAFAQNAMSKLDLVKIARSVTPMDFDFDQWDTMDLPASWNTVDEKYFYYEGTIVFTRKFDIKPQKEKRIFLRIGGSNYRTIVILNGRPMGCHLGGSTDFYVELTDEILKKDNRLIIVVDASRRPERVPAENTDWFNYGGIYRDIELIITPKVFIKNFKLNLVPDNSYSNLHCFVQLSDPLDGKAELIIEELNIKSSITLSGGLGLLEIPVEGLKLWEPGYPKLYDVSLRMLQPDCKDELSDYIGFRQIEAKEGQIYLNGRKIFLKGVSCHEESVENGRSLTIYEIRENFTLAKEMGCNYMRLAHYPHSRESARLADEMGLMLWEEIPVYWAIDFDNRETLEDATNQLTELIKRDWNRASVIIWSIGNENADTDERLKFMSSLSATCRKLDPERMISAACLVNWVNMTLDDRLAEHLDLIGLNEYFGWYEPDVKKLKKFFDNSSVGKPLVISEFGAGMKIGLHGSKKTFFTEEKHRAVYEEQVEVISMISEIRGTSPWILYDFRCPRRNNPYQNYYNLKGLLSADKKVKKPGFYIMQKFYAGL